MDSIDTIEVEDDFNQTLFEVYDGYLHEYKQIFGNHLNKYREEFLNYFYQNAQHLAIALVIYIVFSFCFYSFIMRSKIIRQLGTIPNSNSILFVISHPDDECMFFGPTIVSLLSKPGTKVYLLCLSTGNFNNLGRIRKEELYASCRTLGIPESNIQVINCTLLPDDPTAIWRQEVVGEIVLNFVETYSIDTIISFDRFGVSNHPNHAAIFFALAYLCLEKKLPRYCRAYALESVSKLRKYVAYLDIPLTCLLSSKKYIVPMEKRDIIREAMKAHQSQSVWFRKLYMIFSRYVFINSYREINVLDLELELDIE